MNKYYVNSFDKALLQCSAEELALLSRLWGLDGTASDIVRELYARMQDPIAVRFVWEALSKDEQQVLYQALSVAQGGIRRTDLLIKSHLDPGRYELAIDNLLRYLLLYEQVENVSGKKSNPTSSAAKKLAKNALEKVKVIHAFPDTMKLLYGIGQEIFISDDRATRTLQQLLAQAPDMWLYQGIRRFQGVSWDTDYSRADFKEKIIRTLQKLSDPLAHLPTLSEDARLLYRWLRGQGGRVSMQDVRIHTGLSDHRLWAILHELEHVFLAFDTFSKQERVLFIPRDYASSADPAAGQSAATDEQSEVDTAPKTVLAAEPIVLYDIAVVTNALYQYAMEPTQAGHIPKRIFNKIRPILHGDSIYDYQDNDLYLEVLLAAMRDLRIVQLPESPSEDVKARYEPGSHLDAWALLDLAEQAVQWLQFWVSSGSWHDDRGMNYRPWDHYLLQSRLAREVILRHLSKCTAGQWYTINSLLAEIWQEDAFTARPSSSYARQQTHVNKTPAIREKWNQCDAELYIGILNSTLREMGITSVGFSQENALELERPVNPHVFQLTEFGKSVLATREEVLLEKKQVQPETPAAPARVLIVQPNFELLILQPDLPTLYSILPFVQVKHIGVVSRLTLTKDAVLRALAAGKRVEQIRGALEEHSQKELPQNVLYTLNDWVKNYKEARISQVLLFEVSSEAIAQELCNTPQIKELGLRQIAPCTLVLSSDVNLQQLKRTLEKQGVTVHLSRNIITRSTRYSAATYSIYQ
ncbi:MAG: hypothetical protein E6J34_03690 [Chloroflexi bacterium]|nr:MAG: hypothetical protein E6J34_03690 [Chloroflexota bacterium]